MESILQKGTDARVTHISGFKILYKSIDFDFLKKEGANGNRSLFMTATANLLFAYFINKEGLVKTPHELIEPGAVDTGLMRNQGFFFRLLIKLVKKITPEQSVNLLIDHLGSESKPRVFMREGVVTPQKAALTENVNEYRRLVKKVDEIIAKVVRN